MIIMRNNFDAFNKEKKKKKTKIGEVPNYLQNYSIIMRVFNSRSHVFFIELLLYVYKRIAPISTMKFELGKKFQGLYI
jgi:hypothetical protein